MLAGNDIILRAWSDEDVVFFESIRNNYQLQEKLMTQPRPNSLARVKEWLLTKSGKLDEIFFVIADASSNDAVGYLQVVNIDSLHKRAELGICLSSDHHGKGYGGKAIGEIEKYLHRSFDLRKLMLYVLEDNESAVSFYLKCGFSEVGRLREHFYQNDQFKNVIVMEKFIV